MRPETPATEMIRYPIERLEQKPQESSQIVVRPHPRRLVGVFIEWKIRRHSIRSRTLFQKVMRLHHRRLKKEHII